jgi:hypothetical protein
MTMYDPERWLESCIRCLKEYAEDRFNKSLTDEDGNYVGLEAYEIVMEFPGPDLDHRVMPFQRTIIHFEIDDIISQLVGLGDNVMRTDEIGVVPDNFLIPREAAMHRLNWDVGIWSTDASGGTTSRARAKQTLVQAFGMAGSINALRDFSDGGDGCLEIVGFSGGRFMGDRINDMGVYRMVECTLEIRVFSRSRAEDMEPMPAILSVLIDGDLFIIDGDPAGTEYLELDPD